MHTTPLKSLSYGEFQQFLVEEVMNKMTTESVESPLVHFPAAHDHVEGFLLVHWKEVFEHCRDMTIEEWKQSPCYEVFENEVLEAFNSGYTAYSVPQEQ
ncbi:hypothetical protein [Alkalicoccus chagannorensis]|uniref:hypothetical protein n=1 Tax=Alkalicoccus chagannorensis TaxID=427072 RepID=UPI000411AA3A|nr:hypothetical protein [Alkalicoccus chagannorensis]